ncbi:hypothetical protein SLA2020_408980 [Shorea laevis]
MVRSKAPSKKQQKRGIDFKKIKRKLGRKLPPPQNATNTEIKFKAIVLPEQSVAAEKTGLAVSRKGLTLKELLQQTSHHNSKVRRDALMGIKDLLVKHPAELKSHLYVVIGKLRERISDDDKLVREALYQLFKSVIFPRCNQDYEGPLISVMMAYIFCAMTNFSIEVRLMAFKFFDLVVQYYPRCFFSYAEKVLQNYEDILRQNKFYVEDKGKLKNALAGLVHCLSLLTSNKQEREKTIAEKKVLHAYELDAPTGVSISIDRLKELVQVLIGCFQEFIPLINSTTELDAQSFHCILSILQSIDISMEFLICSILKETPQSKFLQIPDPTMLDQTFSSVLLKKLLGVFPLNPKYHLFEKEDDRFFVLNILISKTFLHLREWIDPPASLFENYLEFIVNALLGKICSDTISGRAIWEKHLPSLLPFIPELVLEVAGDWQPRLLEAFTQTFKLCSPESSLKLSCLSAVEKMLIPRGDTLDLDANDPVVVEYQISWIRELPILLILLGDKHPTSSQVVLRLILKVGQFACSISSRAMEYENIQYSIMEFFGTFQGGNICYGPFTKLPRDCQELSLSCVYYFSNINLDLLRSIASCCLCPELEPSLFFRIIEVLQSAYKAGHIQISDQLSFLITLVTRFNVDMESFRSFQTFKSLTCIVFSCLESMGDGSLILQMLEELILEQMLLNLPIVNACAMLRVICRLDSKPTILSEKSIINLSNFLPAYLINVAHHIPEDDNDSTFSNCVHKRLYYLLPCVLLFDRSPKLLNLVLDIMGSLITGSSSSLPIRGFIQYQYSTDHLSQIKAIVSVLLSMHMDEKMRKNFFMFKNEIDHILQSIASLQTTNELEMNTEERHKLQLSCDQLKDIYK